MNIYELSKINKIHFFQLNKLNQYFGFISNLYVKLHIQSSLFIKQRQ